MIRFAESRDREAVASIWRECFGDEGYYIDFFLNNLFKSERCLIYDYEGTPAAMLHLLPINLIDQAATFKTQYIYAAATLPAFQRRGLMAKLIDFAVVYGIEKGFKFTSLLPANQSLYGYYEKCGFKSAFYIKRTILTRAQLTAAAGNSKSAIIIPSDDKAIYSRRLDSFNSALLWDYEMFSYVLKEWRFTGGEIISFKNGYALCRKTDKGLLIKELCITDGSFAAFASVLLERFEADIFIFYLPQSSQLFENTELLYYGMLRADNDNGVIVESVFKSKPYYNLMLD